jgi:AraC-like DNA-binding protein
MALVWEKSKQHIRASTQLDQAGVTVSTFKCVAGRGWHQVEPATPEAVLIFGVGGKWDIMYRNTAQKQAAFFSGINLRPSLVSADRIEGCIEVRMPPLLAGQLFPGVWMQDGGPIGMKDALNANAAWVVDQILEADDAVQAANLVTDWIESRLVQNTLTPPAEIIWAWQQLTKFSGCIAISDLVSKTEWSHRHFKLQFKKFTGLDPKAAARLIRFSDAYQAIASNYLKLSDVAAKFGYFDQSHMNADFRCFAGQTPNSIR